jgi:hypothetical protein
MPTTVTNDGVRRLVSSSYRVNKDSFLIMDSSYSLIDDAKAKSYFRAVANETFSLIGPWMENIRDCDKFSRAVACIGMLSHMRQSRALTGLALGVFAYTQDTGGGHAINFMLTKVAKKEQINIRFFEPQSGNEVILSKTEQSHILWVLI